MQELETLNSKIELVQEVLQNLIYGLRKAQYPQWHVDQVRAIRKPLVFTPELKPLEEDVSALSLLERLEDYTNIEQNVASLKKLETETFSVANLTRLYHEIYPEEGDNLVDPLAAKLCDKLSVIARKEIDELECLLTQKQVEFRLNCSAWLSK